MKIVRLLAAGFLLLVAFSAHAVGLRFDANGDGKSDILWRHLDGTSFIYLLNDLVAFAGGPLRGPGTAWYIVNTGDFDGDGKSDLLWRNHDTGEVEIWLMNGKVATSTAAIYGSGTAWRPTHVGDFNGDGKADILWQHDDGRVAIWLMNGLSLLSTGEILGAGTGWAVQQLGDFNGDGKSDVVWKHIDGRVAIWLMNGVGWLNFGLGSGDILNASDGLGWSVTHVGDLNGDGKSDLVWTHWNGRAAVWTMNGTTPTATAQILNKGTPWAVQTLGDFNGDGKSDLVFVHNDGTVAVALMNGTTITSSQNILANPAYKVVAAIDAGGDGKSDLLWVHDDGSVVLWLMNGISVAATGLIKPSNVEGWDPLRVPDTGGISWFGIHATAANGTYDQYVYPPLGERRQSHARSTFVPTYTENAPTGAPEAPSWRAHHEGRANLGGVWDAVVHLDWDSTEVHAIRTCRNGEKWVWLKQYGLEPAENKVTYYKVMMGGLDITASFIANCGNDGQPYAKYIVSGSPYRLTVWGDAFPSGADNPDQKWFWDANWSYEASRTNPCWVGGGSNSRPAVKLYEAWWSQFAGWDDLGSGTQDPPNVGIPTGQNVVGNRYTWYALDAGALWLHLHLEEVPNQFLLACLTRTPTY